jgi:hypothetical protein
MQHGERVNSIGRLVGPARVMLAVSAFSSPYRFMRTEYPNRNDRNILF